MRLINKETLFIKEIKRMKNDMTQGKTWKIIINFTLPVIIGNIFQQLYSLVDTMIVGRTLGANAMAAVGSTSSIFGFLLNFIIGITTGFCVILGKYFGSKDEDDVKKSFISGIFLSLIVGVIMTVPTALLTEPILKLMDTPTEIMQEAYDYLVIIFIGAGATLFYNLFSNVARALGDSKSPLVFLIISSVLNIVLDLFMIIVLKMGVKGAAWATVISQLVSAILALGYLLWKFPIIRPKKDHILPDIKSLLHHVALGFPMGFQLSVMSIGLISMQIALNRLGATEVAAFTAASKIDMLALQLSVAFCTSLPPFVAQNFGAKKYDRIKKGVIASLIMSISMSAVASVLIFVFKRGMVGLFLSGDTDPSQLDAIMTLACRYLNIIIIFYTFLSVLCVLRSAIQGLGKTLVPFGACIIELGMRVAGSFVLASYLGYDGVCYSSPLSWMGAAVFLVFGYIITMRNLRKKQSPTLDDPSSTELSLSDNVEPSVADEVSQDLSIPTVQN